jgi:hypothetical protein
MNRRPRAKSVSAALAWPLHPPQFPRACQAGAAGFVARRRECATVTGGMMYAVRIGQGAAKRQRLTSAAVALRELRAFVVKSRRPDAPSAFAKASAYAWPAADRSADRSDLVKPSPTLNSRRRVTVRGVSVRPYPGESAIAKFTTCKSLYVNILHGQSNLVQPSQTLNFLVSRCPTALTVCVNIGRPRPDRVLIRILGPKQHPQTDGDQSKCEKGQQK